MSPSPLTLTPPPSPTPPLRRTPPRPRASTPTRAALRALCGLLLVSLVTPAAAKTYRYPESSKPSSLLPFFVENMSGVRISEFVFESLVTKNKRGDVEGVLAHSWSVSPDGATITFQLKPNVKWHDGKPFTAEDVVFTVEAAQDPKTIFASKSKFRFIRSARVMGPAQVQFTLLRTTKNPAADFTFKIIPKHHFTSTAINRLDRFSKYPVGTGPYKVAKSDLRVIKLDRNADYWGRASIDSIEMMHTPDSNEQINLLKYSGEGAGVQTVIFIPPKSMSTFENSDSVVLEPYHTVAWWYLAFNHKNPALADLSVRKAVALTLNREELLEAHLGQGDLLSGPFTESSPYYNFDVELREQDVEEAKSLLEGAGYKLKGKERVKGNAKLKFDLVINKDLPNCQPLALSIQADLRKTGIVVEPKFVDAALYNEQVMKQGKFDLTVNIWSFEELEDIFPLFRTGQPQNFIGYSNAAIDEQLDASRKESDHKTYKEIMMRLHLMLNDDLPYVFLWSLDVYSGVSRQLSDIFIQPYNYFTFFKDWSFK